MMKAKSNFKIYKGYILLFTWVMLSCGDDGGAITNLPPVIENQSFNASESIDDATVIGTVEASDPEGEALSFAISENSEDLFEITGSGELLLTSGSTLDFETATSHTLIVSVSDGGAEASASITITVSENTVPSIIDQSFTAAEDITDTDVIATVEANDAEGDELTFTISEDLDNLFEITEAGVLSLQEGKSLDFEATKTHNLKVQLTDGTNTTDAMITIEVTNVIDVPFVTTWEVSGDDLRIIIPTTVGDQFVDVQQSYDYTVDWGDGSSDSDVEGDIIHTYDAAGTYTVSIIGQFPHFRMAEVDDDGDDIDENNPPPNGPKLKTIEAWGEIEWASFSGAFSGAINMTYNATDIPNLANVTSLASAFSSCLLFNGDISEWDVSNVTNMAFMLTGANAFDQDIGGWDVSNVTDMSGMLRAESFNQDISGWDVSKVTDMGSMFSSARAFNQDIGGWDVSNVTDISFMFNFSESFNQDISGWKVDKVTNMRSTFTSAKAFNQPLNDWNVANVENLQDTFKDASAFNQPLDQWDVSKVTTMQGTFNRALIFDQDLSGWDTENVTICNNFSFDTPIENTAKEPTLGCFGIR